MPELQTNNSSIPLFIQALIPTSIFILFRKERTFLALIGIFFFLAGVSSCFPAVAHPHADAGYALIGLAVSIALAVSNNDENSVDIWKFLFG